MRRGERLHGVYAQHFRHRYGGNFPGWRGISEQERELWRAVERELRQGARETIDTRQQVVRVKLLRGMLTIGPGATVNGLWEIVRRETLTNEQVRCLCGGIPRSTLARWRTKDFPAPVLTFRASGRPLELWSRTDVRAWLRARGEETTQ